MYRFNANRQYSFTDFNMPAGMKLNPENRWVKKAAIIPWEDIEARYAELFPSKTGMPAKPLRTALGSLLIQKQLGFSDRELVEEIIENPYFQFFIGLPGYQDEAPFVPSLLVEFRKRLTDEVLDEINEMIIEHNTHHDDNGPSSGTDETKTDPDDPGNSGTMILDATCAPQNISFPQDINLLNEAREDLEDIIDAICAKNGLYVPRTYRNIARKDYLSLARCKKRTVKKIRKAIKKQLQYIRRDIGYIESFMECGYSPSDKHGKLLEVIHKVYDQQQYMYDNKIHTIEDRIVSISQPYIRPIVRGKAASPVEFGAKLDLSLDDDNLARIEKLSFDAYNESDVLIGAVERYRERTGHYPERVLADKIYRNRRNLSYCKEHCIRLSGPALGRPKKDMTVDKGIEYRDNADRVAVERSFALAKHSYGLGRIVTKLEETTRSSISLSVIAMNIDRIVAVLLRRILNSVFSRYIRQKNLSVIIQIAC